MITSSGILYKVKCCGIVALLTFNTSVCAQQLYSDSAVAAKTEQNLCMTLPDSAAVVANINSLLTEPVLIDLSQITMNYSFIPQCGECFTYSHNYINFASLFVSPVWSFQSPSVSLDVSSFVQEPIGAECNIGIASCAPVQGIQFASYISVAAKNLSALVSDSSDHSGTHA